MERLIMLSMLVGCAPSGTVMIHEVSTASDPSWELVAEPSATEPEPQSPDDVEAGDGELCWDFVAALCEAGDTCTEADDFDYCVTAVNDAYTDVCDQLQNPMMADMAMACIGDLPTCDDIEAGTLGPRCDMAFPDVESLVSVIEVLQTL